MSVIKKPQIPSTSYLQAEIARVINPIKENLELLTGVKGAQINQLVATAVLSDVTAKVNELVARLNARGS